jgi:hypothetical protein
MCISKTIGLSSYCKICVVIYKDSKKEIFFEDLIGRIHIGWILVIKTIKLANLNKLHDG